MELDTNLNVRGCEKIGLIGNGHNCAIITNNGTVEFASLKSPEYFSESSDTPENKKNLGIYVNDLLTIEIEKQEEPCASYIKDTDIFLVMMKNLYGQMIEVNYFYPREIGKRTKNVLIVHVHRKKEYPLLRISLTPKVNRRQLDIKAIKEYSIVFENDCYFSLSQEGIIEKIYNDEWFYLSKDLTIAFGVDTTINLHRHMLKQSFDFWINYCKKITIPKDINEGVKTEIRRAFILMSHCECLDTGYIFKSAVERIHEKNFYEYKPVYIITNFYAYKYFTACDLLKYEKPLMSHHNFLVKISLNSDFLNSEHEAISKDCTKKQNFFMHKIENENFSNLMGHYEDISCFVLSIVAIAKKYNNYWYKYRKVIIQCVDICRAMKKRWAKYFLNPKHKPFFFSSLKIALSCYAIETMVTWMHTENIADIFLKNYHVWMQQIEEMKRELLEAATDVDLKCYSSLLIFGKIHPKEKRFIHPNILLLHKLNICSETDPLLLNSLARIEQMFFNDGILKITKTVHYNVLVLFLFIYFKVANFLYVEFLSYIDAEKATNVFRKLRGLLKNDTFLPNILKIVIFFLLILKSSFISCVFCLIENNVKMD